MKKPAFEALKALYLREYYKKFPSIPENQRFAPKYTDKTANQLTKCILDFLKYNGHQAERISCTGRYIDNSKLVTDCIGRVRKVGTGKYIPASMQKGTADISAIIYGKSVKIEVKIGSDRLSDHQKKYAEQVEAAGGVYVVAKEFEDFYVWYNLTFGNKTGK